MLTGANACPDGKPENAPIIDLAGSGNFFRTFLKAIKVCRQRRYGSVDPLPRNRALPPLASGKVPTQRLRSPRVALLREVEVRLAVDFFPAGRFLSSMTAMSLAGTGLLNR